MMLADGRAKANGRPLCWQKMVGPRSSEIEEEDNGNNRLLVVDLMYEQD